MRMKRRGEGGWIVVGVVHDRGVVLGVESRIQDNVEVYDCVDDDRGGR